MKIGLILLILGLWFLKFNAEEFLVNIIPIKLISWIGIILVVLGAYRIGIKKFRFSQIKRIFKD